MAVDESLNALSTTASSNTPAGTDAVGTDLDDHLRDIKKNIKLAASLQAGINQPTGFRGQLWNDTSRTASSVIALRWFPHLNWQELVAWDFSASAVHQLTHVTPQTDNTYDLGTALRSWRQIFIGGNGNEPLSEYDEGTFTPGVAFGGASVGVTYTTQIGRYTRIGNRVFFFAFVLLSSNGSSTGSASMTGLPFTSANVANVDTPCVVYPSAFDLNVGGAYYQVVGLVNSNSTTINLNEVGDNVSAANLTEADIGDTSSFRIAGFYEAA